MVSCLLLQSALSRHNFYHKFRQKLFMPNARAEMHSLLVGELLSRVMIFGLERAVKLASPVCFTLLKPNQTQRMTKAHQHSVHALL